MTNVVVDTNVLVSALLAPAGKPAQVLALILNGRATICYDSRILLEYKDVLYRPKFPFAPEDVAGLLRVITQIGTAVVAPPLPDSFSDESDKKFFEVARATQALLITGNVRHFPRDACIISPADFLNEIH